MLCTELGEAEFVAGENEIVLKVKDPNDESIVFLSTASGPGCFSWNRE